LISIESAENIRVHDMTLNQCNFNPLKHSQWLHCITLVAASTKDEESKAFLK
jgi:hypothetical protein